MAAGISAPRLLAKRDAIIAVGKRFRTSPRSVDELTYIFAYPEEDPKWTIRKVDPVTTEDEAYALELASQETIDKVFRGGSKDYPGNCIPPDHAPRFVTFLRRIVIEFGAPPILEAEARALWEGHLHTFEQALMPVSPGTCLLRAEATPYHPLPSWELVGYQKRAGPVPGVEPDKSAILYHPHVAFFHKLAFATAAPKRVMVLSGIFGGPDGPFGKWSVYLYSTARKARPNTGRSLKWPVSDPVEFPELRTIKSTNDLGIYVDDGGTGYRLATRDPEAVEGRQVFLGLGWFETSRHKPKMEDIGRWAAHGPGELTASTGDEIAAAFLKAQSDGEAELYRGEIRFGWNGRREKPA